MDYKHKTQQPPKIQNTYIQNGLPTITKTKPEWNKVLKSTFKHKTSIRIQESNTIAQTTNPKWPHTKNISHHTPIFVQKSTYIDVDVVGSQYHTVSLAWFLPPPPFLSGAYLSTLPSMAMISHSVVCCVLAHFLQKKHIKGYI